MTTVLGVIGFVIVMAGLMLSIALHEIGHLLPAKKFGVRVSQYMVGFGPTLWSRTRGETEYGVKAIPLGGYIRMIGMFPPRNDGNVADETRGRLGTMIEDTRAESLSEIVPGEESRTFYNLSVPRKLTVMFGGPVTNLILAFVLFTISMCVIGSPQATTTLSTIYTCVPTDSNPTGIASVDGGCGEGVKTSAALLGLRAGDQLVAINGVALTNWYDLGSQLRGQQGKPTVITFNRDGVSKTESVVLGQITDAEGTRGFLGVSPSTMMHKESITHVGPFMNDLARESVSALGTFPTSVYHLARELFSSTPRDPNGPVSVIGIGKIGGEIASMPDISLSSKVASSLDLLGSLNLFLFLFNMLPILPLDGGHIAGALYEGLRRTWARIRRVSDLPGPADTAKLMPLAYIVSIALVAMSAVVILADIIKPISLG